MMRSEPIFAVSNLPDTIAFYRNRLGGEGEWTYGEPAEFGGIRINGSQVLFELDPELAQQARGIGHFFFCNEIDDQYKQHLAAGAPIAEAIEDKPWGIREYVVIDPNGVRLRFCGPIGYEKPADALQTLPDHIAIENRLPTDEEYLTLLKSVDWGHTPEYAAVLQNTLEGFVAVDRDNGSAVGMARVVRDARLWYSIWDVVVRPEYQSKQIGTAIMDAAVSRLREIVPAGSFVHLFTLKPAFYERLGFQETNCHQIRL
ncbi:MAG: GNAT family N-acetyltransferase [Planctomycetota bacterium]